MLVKHELVRLIENYAKTQNITFIEAIDLLKDCYINDEHNTIVLIDIEKMQGLSLRVKRILQRNGLKTSYDLHGLSEIYFLKMQGFSNKSLLELKEASKIHGFYIKKTK